MKTSKIIFLFLFFFSVRIVSAQFDLKLGGSISMEGKAFFLDGLYQDQDKYSISVAVQPEFYYRWKNGSGFSFSPFVRLAKPDSRKSHFDIREFNIYWFHENIELRAGMGIVFWGVTEFVHLIDIINQTDLVESIWGDKKLGQFMIHLSLLRKFGVLDMFILPWFRERTFPGRKGRLRLPILIDTNNPRYQSAKKYQHIDAAIRYSHSLGMLDFGLHYFYGTSREPTMQLGLNTYGKPSIFPFYELINQIGFDMQLVLGSWILKFESYGRNGQGDDYFALTGGFEYSIIGIFGTHSNITLYVEYAYDYREDKSTLPYENDVMGGFRFALNDPGNTEVFFGFIQDIGSDSHMATMKINRRFGAKLKIFLEGILFYIPHKQDLMYCIRKDEYVKASITYYF